MKTWGLVAAFLVVVGVAVAQQRSPQILWGIQFRSPALAPSSGQTIVMQGDTSGKVRVAGLAGVNNALLLANGTDFLLLVDGASFLCLASGC